MPISALRFRPAGRTLLGVARNGAVTPVPGEFATTRDFLAANPIDKLAALDGPTTPERDVELLSPFTGNQQFLCQGANYRQRMIESGADPEAKSFNMIFTKATSCLAPADTDFVKTSRVRFLDYEIDLGLVLKHDINAPVRVSETNLHEFVAGVTIVNDYSARDVQIPQMQFGKGFAPSAPLDPISAS
jgi:2,4-didehydro-3-deoxy-L-rhamnonate hydrolase